RARCESSGQHHKYPADRQGLPQGHGSGPPQIASTMDRTEPVYGGTVISWVPLRPPRSRSFRSTGAESARRLDPEQRSLIFVRENVQESIRTLSHVADPLSELRQQRLS